MDPTDEQLIASYRASGDPDDLGPLVTRHTRRVRDFAYRMLRCDAAADDVTQEVFVQVFRNLHRFRGDAKFTTWLYRISLNATRQHLRRSARLAAIELPKAPLADAGQTEPPADAIGSELDQAIQSALGMLSVKMRTAIVLTQLEQLSPAEAAKIEGCSAATMRWRVHSARRQLKAHLRSYVKE